MKIDFDAAVVLGLAATVMTLILTVGANSYASTRADNDKALANLKAKAEAIKSGADPLAVSCAFDGAGQLCAVLVARK